MKIQYTTFFLTKYSSKTVRQTSSCPTSFHIYIEIIVIYTFFTTTKIKVFSSEPDRGDSA